MTDEAARADVPHGDAEAPAAFGFYALEFVAQSCQRSGRGARPSVCGAKAVADRAGCDTDRGPSCLHASLQSLLEHDRERWKPVFGKDHLPRYVWTVI
jgi:hypothetical protein